MISYDVTMVSILYITMPLEDNKSWDSPGHAGDEAAEELLCQGLGQATARLGSLVDDHGTVKHVGAVGPQRQTDIKARRGRNSRGGGLICPPPIFQCSVQRPDFADAVAVHSPGRFFYNLKFKCNLYVA